ncbi:family 1 encapsulin nanocompartment shell protein [Nonomuraea sp. NPDC000554]|uniref:encapsulin n=1 Tax=Nonomuraea sp. NPDC000554 TaxID=3154259 RepID=UPI003320237C
MQGGGQALEVFLPLGQDQAVPARLAASATSALMDGEIIWAPVIDGAFLLSTRGGDFELHIGQDVSIGYLTHDATSVQLYFQETLTFLVCTGEAIVTMSQ